MTFSSRLVVAGFGLLLVSGHSIPGHHHQETAIVWPLFSSAVLMSMAFALCQTPSTAPWMWQVINSVVSGLLAMQWCSLIAQFEPSKGEAAEAQRLMIWIFTYIGVTGLLYLCALSGKEFAVPPVEAFSWVIATVAGSFITEVLPAEEEGSLFAVVVILLEQIIFYGVWMIPRTIEMGLKGWSIHGVQIGVPGCNADASGDYPLAKWRADCDSMTWGAAPFAFAGTTLRMLKHHITSDPKVSATDRAAWVGLGSYWGGFAVAFLLATAISAHHLTLMKDHRGIVNIVGSLFLSALPTTAAMCWLNFLRASINDAFCAELDMCDDGHPVFLSLHVAYAATLTAMLSAIVMPQLRAAVVGAHWKTILQCCQNAIGTQAGLAWYACFSAAVGSKALDKVGLQGDLRLALLLSATIGPLYVYYIRPANCRAQAAPAHAHQD